MRTNFTTRKLNLPKSPLLNMVDCIYWKVNEPGTKLERRLQPLLICFIECYPIYFYSGVLSWVTDTQHPRSTTPPPGLTHISHASTDSHRCSDITREHAWLAGRPTGLRTTHNPLGIVVPVSQSQGSIFYIQIHQRCLTKTASHILHYKATCYNTLTVWSLDVTHITHISSLTHTHTCAI